MEGATSKSTDLKVYRASSEDGYVPSETPVSSDENSPIASAKGHKKRDRSNTDAVVEEERPPSSRVVPEFARPHKRSRSGFHSLDAYQLLYYSALDGSDQPDTESQDTPYESSNIGVSRWTGEEKALFFQALDQHGRDNLLSISREIQTKSQLEVAAYIKQLQEGAAGLPDRDAETGEAVLLPAAAEVRPDCDETLDAAADALRSREFDHDEKVERVKFGLIGLLDKHVCGMLQRSELQVDRLLQVQGTDPSEALFALKLFDLSCFLRLSTEYFMTSTDPEWHYLTYARFGETPSMHLSALVEISRVVVPLLERLMRTTLNCAASRLKAKEWKAAHRSTKRPTRVVKAADVHAAIGILRLKEPQLQAKLAEYWEQFRERLTDEDRATLDNPDGIIGEVNVDTEEAHLQESTADESETAGTVISGSDSSGSGDAEIDEHDDLADEEDMQHLEMDDYLDRLDNAASRAEEARLLRVCNAAELDQVEEGDSHAPTPPSGIQLPSARLDWRAQIDQHSLWQHHPEEAAEHDLIETESLSTYSEATTPMDMDEVGSVNRVQESHAQSDPEETLAVSPQSEDESAEEASSSN